MNLFLQIHRFHRNYMARLTTMLVPDGLTPGNWSLLQFLHEHESATSSQLAAHWDVEKPTVSGNVKQMLALDLIAVMPGEDKREKKLALTENGSMLYEKLSTEIAAMQERILQDVPPTVRTQLEQALAIAKCANEGKSAFLANICLLYTSPSPRD